MKDGASTNAGDPGLCIRAAGPREGERLRQIAIASKSYWGYDLDRVREWAALGDFSSEGLRKKEFYVADVAGEAVGWAALISRREVYWLDDLWIEPEWIGSGVGTRQRAGRVGAGERGDGRRVLLTDSSP